ncbi:YeeE/YedE thiosulfate transporter family protein [Colwellia sp. 4_MG-2023]|uniref:YeeE/YedE thiosulfate transporter family protein n=1 Tax=unclassified Colwellia TaxID=196834 RepID=UPI001C096E21|nr:MULTISPECIES: YeeE/YedE thiosulfate transporter family protein [unclassified Colwellia]MBU2923438.1 YeeE/YedE family protein [Colwellia sp. C2M11]MDO6508118.1 YeeE/YedE thiosulfate transporter family protein [Colwellia sp. 5_MG-2023]MDO6556858.1 YeeE/YedE thiosulfate transporter family protein [Colwellia sp. 4_MG-2023]MDO6653798.1 YeeE/YedE thiosulfate transporter family protein [Colwellia sp. 3_MG-2023]MDO6666690.1 YeeE/YedE thiosulfate transporter family protein [Colwellia sp. 2_MG-2023]
MLFISVFICVCFLGYLAQTTGLCMVRGVNEWQAGNKEFLLAIIFSGVLAWVGAYFSQFFDIKFTFWTHALSGWFVLGGFIFGLGAALNKSCGVSTLSRLARGDSRMFATILGWFVGWVLLACWPPKIEVVRSSLPGEISYIPLILITIAITIWGLVGDKKRKKLWFGMMGIGLLSGFIFLYQPQWPPSVLLQQISLALINGQNNNWPLIEQYLFFIAMLLGMFLAAWRTKRFNFIPANVSYLAKHLFAGTLMGVGASIAMGGNSVQLLLALPTLSPSGFGAVAGMLLGIWGGSYIIKCFKWN